MTRSFIRPLYFALVRSGLPGRVAWGVLRVKRATRLGNYLYLRRKLAANKNNQKIPLTSDRL